MNNYSLPALLELSSVPGIGANRLRKLIDAFGSPDAVLEAPVQRLMHIHGIDKTSATRIKTGVNKKFAEEQLRLLDKFKIRIITYWDDQYPELLKKIYDAPAFFYIKGNLKPDDNLAFGIVGTRIPTHYGRLVTEQFSKELVDYNFTIVSGFARGIDTVAHRSALNNYGRTIAVLGSGIDRIYPSENRKLVEQICDNGAIISEYPVGTNPDAPNFPKRNRIISGLSLGILVVEAGIKSGALITAFQALEQNKEVFAVPGPINSSKSTGTNRIIKEGAKLVQGTRDILSELENQVEIKRKKKAESMPALEKKENEIYKLLSASPVHVDQIAQKSKKSIPEVLSILLTLELLGVAKQLSGKMFISHEKM
jgi:DNA processing protein